MAIKKPKTRALQVKKPKNPLTELGLRESHIPGNDTFNAPLWMDKECKKIFKIIEASLRARQNLSHDDYTILSTYIFNIYQYTVLTATIAKEGAIVKDSNGVDTINQSLKARSIIHKEINQQQKVLGIGSLYQRQLLSIPDFVSDESVDAQNLGVFDNDG